MSSDQSLKLHALLNILRELNSGSNLTPAQLAKSLEVTERTIYRYITSLQSAGYPIYFDRKINSYCLSDGFTLSKHCQSNELLQALDIKRRMIGTLSIGLLAYDMTGQCKVANDAAAAILGGSRSQLLKQNFYTLDSWKTSGLLLLAGKVMDTGLETCKEFQIRTSFNKTVWALYCMSRFEQTGKHYLMVVFQDITEKKQNEKELQQLAEQFQVLANTTMDAFWIVDDSGRILEVNGRTCAIYGYSRSEMKNMLVVEIDEDADRDIIQERMRCVIADGYYRFETRHKVKNGSSITVEVSVAYLSSSHRFLAFIKDISRQKSVEQRELQLRDDKYKRLFETMAIGVVFQEADGKISSANPAAERILGISLEQMQGKTSIDPAWKTIREDGSTISGMEHPSMVALTTGAPVFDFIMGVYNPGRQMHSWLLITAIPLIRPGEPTPYQVYTTFRDITEFRATPIMATLQ